MFTHTKKLLHLKRGLLSALVNILMDQDPVLRFCFVFCWFGWDRLASRHFWFMARPTCTLLFGVFRYQDAVRSLFYSQLQSLPTHFCVPCDKL